MKITNAFRPQFLLFMPLLLAFCCLMTGCSDDDNEPEVPEIPPLSPISDNTITIKDIRDIPADFTFDKVRVKIQGADWKNIRTLEFPYKDGQIVMSLPVDFLPEELQKVDRRNNDMSGHWPGTSSDPDALVASLGDFFVYDGEEKVGRLAITNWSGTGSSAEKAFIYYHFADRPFSLTGSDNSFYYSNCSFNREWNAYANINPSEGSSQKILRTTSLPESTLFWRLADTYVRKTTTLRK